MKHAIQIKINLCAYSKLFVYSHHFQSQRLIKLWKRFSWIKLSIKFIIDWRGITWDLETVFGKTRSSAKRNQKILTEKKNIYLFTKCKTVESIIHNCSIKHSCNVWFVILSTFVRFKIAVWVRWILLKRCCFHFHGYYSVIAS